MMIVIKDSEIQKNVLEELKYEPSLSASEIGVAVKDGVVTLSGTVDSYLKKKAAERVTKRIAGVKVVAEDIEVKYEGAHIKNDTEIAIAVSETLRQNVAVIEEKIKVKVENGVITLEGEVEWEFQKKSAESEIERLIGVKAIISKITIKSKEVPKNIRANIIKAFHRNASVDADKISIEISGSRVILNGKVRSWAESEDAENAVWASPGVSRVENNLEVEQEEIVY
jgi:osmotically-inducible protein OsmY